MIKNLNLLSGVLKYFSFLELEEDFYSCLEGEEERQIVYVIQRFANKYQRAPNNYSEFEIYYLELLNNKEIITTNYIQELVLKKAKVLFERECELALEVVRDWVRKVYYRGRVRKRLSDLIEKYKAGEYEKLQEELGIREGGEEVFDLQKFLTLDRPVRSLICPTGFQYLDYYMEGGLAMRELALIAAPPGFGKTTFLLNLCCNGLLLTQAQSLPFSFLYVTLELSPEEIFSRVLSILFDVPLKKIKELPPKELRDFLIPLIGRDEVDNMFSLISQKLKVLYVEPLTSIDTLLLKIEKSISSPGVVFIDYLQEIDELSQKEIWGKYELIMTKLDAFINEKNLGCWIASQAHKKSNKQGMLDISDLYAGKVGATKKISFGIGLTFQEDVQRHRLNFFKNRLKGKITDTTFIWPETPGSLKLTEELKIYNLDLTNI